MRIQTKIRFVLTLLMVLSLLSPTALAAVGEGKKQFKKGLKHEIAEEWDKAAEAFSLAVADNPKNPEYRLHYLRAMFNASQMYMQRGRLLADENDYAGAYIAFRKAYGYDPVNELAKTEMERMLRLQKAEIDGNGDSANVAHAALIKTGLTTTGIPDNVAIPQRYEKLRDVPFPSGVDLQFLIRELAKDLDLNVLFDTSSFRTPKRIKIELKNVTAAKALDYIFLQEGLFFEKVGPRTIIVAASTRRQFFQQLVLRTFYLANADPKDVAAIIQKAIPAQPGRTPTIVLTDEDTNSLTIRDTAENISLMSQLIKSLDKDRAEVVMDVQIYEVSKNDLLQIGNQFGRQANLTNLGGSTSAIVRGNSPGGDILSAIGKTDIFGVALAIPAANLAAFQRKNNTKLLASTQIHAFNNEDSSARIGQRVPVQTASVSSFNTGAPGQTTNNVFGSGFPVINYEQVGLTLKFKPIVFPNQDVQVSMEIESKDVLNSSSLTPTFTERIIKGTARIQNNKTLLLASVAQGVESKGREGLPLLGMIPILGRLFTAPTRDNRQVDIVIAVTPRVIRAPAVLPEDVIERPTGSLAVPTSGSLAALLIKEEIERQQALARNLPTNTEIQLPDQKVPTYIRTGGSDDVSQSVESKAPAESATAISDVNQNLPPEISPALPTENEVAVPNGEASDIRSAIVAKIRPIDSSTRTLDLKRTLNVGSDDSDPILVSRTSLTEIPEIDSVEGSDKPAAVATLQMLPTFKVMKAGDTLRAIVLVSSATPFRSAVLGLKFDAAKLSVKSVSFGDAFGPDLARKDAEPFFNQDGKLYVSFSASEDIATNSSGILGFIDLEILEDGVPRLEFDPDMMNMLTVDGINFAIEF